jgi:hypothetical protein
MEDALTLLHLDLIEEVSWGIPSLYESWRTTGYIDPFMLLWPRRTVMFEGQPVNDSIPLQLPEEQKERNGFIAQMCERYSAWAFMRCEEQDLAVSVLFESPQGAKRWRLPIVKIGATRSLGEPEELTDEKEYVGLLWRPQPAPG